MKEINKIRNGKIIQILKIINININKNNNNKIIII
jgi:hypothetical protein